MDIFGIMQAAVDGFPLFMVVMAIVEMLKKTGLKGSQLTVTSLVVGAVIGSFYMIISSPAAPGTDMVGYVITVVVYGGTVGLVASGLYDAAKSIFAKATEKAITDFSEKK